MVDRSSRPRTCPHRTPELVLRQIVRLRWRRRLGPVQIEVEWAYRQIFTSNTARAEALAPWLEHYNTRRRHSALGGRPPISRLT